MSELLPEGGTLNKSQKKRKHSCEGKKGYEGESIGGKKERASGNGEGGVDHIITESMRQGRCQKKN